MTAVTYFFKNLFASIFIIMSMWVFTHAFASETMQNNTEQQHSTIKTKVETLLLEIENKISSKHIDKQVKIYSIIINRIEEKKQINNLSSKNKTILEYLEISINKQVEAITQKSQRSVEDITGVIILENSWFDLPETILHDTENDIYLVSNISGVITEKDDTGFISKVSPQWDILDLKWIDWNDEDVILHSPKWIAIYKDNLYVADIDTIRVFNRTTWVQIKNIVIDNTTFLNDIIIWKDGTMYVTESALDTEFKPTWKDAIFKVTQDGTISALAKWTHLNQPNGLILLENGDVKTVMRWWYYMYSVTPSWKIKDKVPTPVTKLDGLVLLENWDYLISSWDAPAVYRLAKGDTMFIKEFTASETPANMQYDYSRKVLLMPLLKNNTLIFMPLK